MRTRPELQGCGPDRKYASPSNPSGLIRRQRNRTAIILGLFALALLLLTGCEKKEEKPKPGPPEVLVAEVVQQNVPIFNEWVAQLNGPVNAEITPKVQGYLLKQDYQNGFFVKKGQLLFELDPRQYEAAVDQAKAQVAVAQAKLAEATTNVDRDTPLAAQNAIPQKQLDTDLANQAAIKAEVLAQQANLQNAELNLAWTKVYSPIDGIAGVSNSQIGDLVGTSYQDGDRLAGQSHLGLLQRQRESVSQLCAPRSPESSPARSARHAQEHAGGIHPGQRRALSRTRASSST